MKKFATTSIMSLIALLVITSSGITASFAANDKITICHRTDSVTNPYVQITVDPSAADEDTGNDNGQGDHAAEHQGPVPTNETEAQAFKDAHIEWGDIIPPHDNFAGLNWTSDGQAIYNNGCNYTSVTPTATPSVTETVTPTEVTPTEVTPTPSTSSGPTATPSPTNPCEGASCNTGGNSPTPSTSSGPTATPTEVTPTVTVTATPSAKPTTSSAPTATATPTVSSAPIGGAAATATPQPTGAVAGVTSGPAAESVLGAAAMAPTGSFAAIVMNILGFMGALLIGLGFLTGREIKNNR